MTGRFELRITASLQTVSTMLASARHILAAKDQKHAAIASALSPPAALQELQTSNRATWQAIIETLEAAQSHLEALIQDLHNETS